MKKAFSLICILFSLFFSVKLCAGTDFDQYFSDHTLRVDYFHTGNRMRETISIDRFVKQGIWAGSQKNLTDEFNNGQYYCKVYDAASGKLIFSRGYNTYFYEYRTTTPAINGISRTFHESVLMPFPKNRIVFTIETRDSKLNLVPLFSVDIDPASAYIDNSPLKLNTLVTRLHYSGHPHNRVDIAILAEGYTKNDREKLSRDFKRVREILFSHDPYRKYKKKINLYGVCRFSEQSGTDEPRNKIYRNTALNTSFNALDLPRYLLTRDNRSMRDMAAHVPYDAVMIMVNHSRYGGGGIYNLYSVFTIDNLRHPYLMLHEFGHSFAGLGDEYYSSRVAYNDFIPPGVEPMEPNVTALLDPLKLKWQKLATPGVAIPTLWDKENFDKMSGKEKSAHLKLKKFKNIVGAFEGACYASTGLYRPAINCIMFTTGTLEFCPVCRAAVVRMIRFYSD